LEQLESLPVIRCFNGSSVPGTDKPEVLPTPPENEDDLNESSSANVELTTSNVAAANNGAQNASAQTNGYAKDVDLGDEDPDDSRSRLLTLILDQNKLESFSLTSLFWIH